MFFNEILLGDLSPKKLIPLGKPQKKSFLSSLGIKNFYIYIFIYFSPKIVEKCFLSKSLSGYFKTKKKKKKRKKKKKVPMATKPRGG